MQAFAPVVSADFLEPSQEINWKLEVWDGAAWQDLTELGGSGGQNYLISMSVSLGGAGITTVPIAGSWSANISNEDGIFHPLHPTSPYASLLRVGREVRLSLGGNYGGTEHSWQRMVGFMEAPRFVHGNRTVELNGMDYMKLLTDTVLRDVNPVAESGSGSSGIAADDVINGPLHWGRCATFDAIASPGADLGPELYVGGDACEIGAGEVNGAGGWIRDTTSPGAVSPLLQVITPAQESTYALRLMRPWSGTAPMSIVHPNAAPVVAGTSVQITFWARRLHGVAGARMIAYNFGPDGVARKVGEVEIGVTDGSWAQYIIIGTDSMTPAVHIASTGGLRLKLYTGGDYSYMFDVCDIDNISIRQYATDFWQRYTLPPGCNGPWLVTLDGEPVGQGAQEAGTGGWHYVEETRNLFFSDTMVVRAGLGSVKIYYYTSQVLENILADLLVWSGLYADRATALTDMAYVPTGITLKRVWFDSGDSALTATGKICERANYRYWHAFDGQPYFQPAPVAEAIAFAFPKVGDLRDLSEAQDDGMIWNRVTIEGAERAMYQVTRDDKANDKYKAEAFDLVSIGVNLEKNHAINNHLFQSQQSVNDMCGILLAEFKDPRWYAELEMFANPVPLEIGDLISWRIQLQAIEVDSGSMSGEGSGDVTIDIMGIIRDVKINDAKVNYKVEVADDFWSTGDLWSGSESASGSIDSGSGSTVPEDVCGDDFTGNDSGMSGSPGYVVFEVPSGVTAVTFEGWGTGGKSSSEGGGGGGAAYARVAVAVTPGQLFYLYPPSSIDAPAAAEVYDDGSNLILSAEPGDDAVNNIGAAGGLAVACTGDVAYDGGDGADAEIEFGGGGGATAGPSGPGGNASFRHGGHAPFDGHDGGNGGFVVLGPGEPGDGPGAGMGGRYPDDGMLPQPGRIRVRCFGEPESESVSESSMVTEEIYAANDFHSGAIQWNVPNVSGWESDGPPFLVTFEGWGMGGPGSTWPVYDRGGAGGGGGAYSKVTVAAVPGDHYHIRAGEVGSGGSVDTYVKEADDATFVLKAERGFYPPDHDTGGPGGDAANGIGDVKRSGGAGHAGSGNNGGGGGSSAGPNADGNSAGGLSGAAAVEDGGRGCDGSDTSGVPGEGFDFPYDCDDSAKDMCPGGGGGRPYSTFGGGAGQGGGGKIRITYTLP